ncbi:hypothetical protein BDW67DRAFT_189445 [Aspergillus spinulosporus]
MLRLAFQHLVYHIHTLYLFIFSDLKTIILPSTLFGIVNSLLSPAYGLDLGPNQTPSLTDALTRTPTVLLWIVLNFIPFAISNQNSLPAIAEDLVNKPWRPIPQRRITGSQAFVLMLAFHSLSQLYGLFAPNGAGEHQSLLLLVLGTWYNNLGGADSNPVTRNLINALGYICFTSGSLEVAIQRRLVFSLSDTSCLSRWFLIITGIIFSTVHLQDMSYQVGDARRGRRTVPLVFGDGAARWTISIPMVVWGFVCPAFWGARWYSPAFLMSLGLACAISSRVLVIRSVKGDRATFRLWNGWIALVFLMPLLVRL